MTSSLNKVGRPLFFGGSPRLRLSRNRRNTFRSIPFLVQNLLKLSPCSYRSFLSSQASAKRARMAAFCSLSQFVLRLGPARFSAAIVPSKVDCNLSALSFVRSTNTFAHLALATFCCLRFFFCWFLPPFFFFLGLPRLRLPLSK